MELQSCVDAVVHAGIQSYIGLLCCGERARSRRLFADTMQISSLAAGSPAGGAGRSGVARRCSAVLHAAESALLAPGPSRNRVLGARAVARRTAGGVHRAEPVPRDDCPARGRESRWWRSGRRWRGGR